MTNLLSCGLVLIALAFTASPAAAQWAPWCLYESDRDSGAVTCIFHSFEQCLATRSGIGGSCARNPYLSGAPYPGDGQTEKRKLRR